MGKRLKEILLEVETVKFEKDMWTFAVNKYFHLSKNNNGEQLTEKFYNELDNKFNSSQRNKVLLENMNIGYMVTDESDTEFDQLLEQFKKQIDDESISEEILLETSQKLFLKSQDLAKGNQISEEITDIFANLGEKWAKVKSTWSEMLNVFKEWMEAAKLSINEVIAILVNEGFIAAFKTTMSKLFKGLKNLLNVWTDIAGKIQNFIFKGLKEGKVGKSLNEISAFLDKKLNQDDDAEWKKYARWALGLGVVYLTYTIWLNMFFIGDWKYDFDFSAAIGTITGTVDFQQVLGANFIPTLTWFVAGLVSNTLNLAIPCPPSCSWFGSWNLVAAGFVTAYIMSTNGSLKEISNSKIGLTVKNWLQSIDTGKRALPKDKEAQTLLDVGKTKLIISTI